MFYHSFDASTETWTVGTATSKDGFVWTKRGPIFAGSGSRGDFDGKGAAACHVVRDYASKRCRLPRAMLLRTISSQPAVQRLLSGCPWLSQADGCGNFCHTSWQLLLKNAAVLKRQPADCCCLLQVDHVLRGGCIRRHPQHQHGGVKGWAEGLGAPGAANTGSRAAGQLGRWRRLQPLCCLHGRSDALPASISGHAGGWRSYL